MLIFAPDRKFFRKRGLEDFVFKPYDSNGDLLTGEGGMAVGPDRYVDYLKTVLPRTYFNDPEWGKYKRQLEDYHAAGGTGDVAGASYSG
jgi:hypothetical protein